MSTVILDFIKEENVSLFNIKSSFNLTQAVIGREYTIKNIDTNDEEIKGFLYTLGCYSGEDITVISILAGNLVISVKDARYSIDRELAETIKI